MYNTIRLVEGYRTPTKREYKGFEKGDTLFDDNYKDLKTWTKEEEKEAYEELAKYKCTYYDRGDMIIIQEYGLVFDETDEDGDFISRYGVELAKEELK